MDGVTFGSAHRATDSEGDDGFDNISYKTKLGTLTGFAYLVDEDEAVVALRRNSSQTYGARFAGEVPFTKKVKLSYLASYARQSDYATNPVDRKSVVSGKRVSARVDLGGPRIINKKNDHNNTQYSQPT